MLGAIIGDIVGSRFEFDNHRSKEFELFAAECEATDDTIMTLAIARAIMETSKAVDSSDRSDERDELYCKTLEELSVKYMQEIGRRYPHCGYGGMFLKWVFSDEPSPYSSFGNGAAMRVSPAGFEARTEREAIRFSRAVTAVTHNHSEGIKGAEATALAVFLARKGFSKEDIRRRIERDYYRLDFTIDCIRDSYRFNETCQETVPQAIEAFIEAESFEDTIRTAISVGGDSDTLAAIAGGIAEAYYGVPDEMRLKALSYLDRDLREIFDEWYG